MTVAPWQRGRPARRTPKTPSEDGLRRLKLTTCPENLSPRSGRVALLGNADAANGLTKPFAGLKPIDP
jgi:hypothetical protein